MEKIYELMDQLMDAIIAETKTNMNKADAAKDIINEQLAIMDEAADALFEMSDAFNEMAEKLEDVADKQFRSANTISAFVEDMSILPEGNVSTFVGNCSGCGDEIYEGEEYDTDERGNLLCGDCLEVDDDEDLDEDGEPKQLTFFDKAD